MTRCASAVCSLLPRVSDITSLRPWKWQQPQFCACSDQAVVLSELQASLQPTFKVHFFFLLIYLDRSVYCRGGGSFRKKKSLTACLYMHVIRGRRRDASLQVVQSELREPPSSHPPQPLHPRPTSIPPSSPLLQALSLSSFLSNRHSLFTFAFLHCAFSPVQFIETRTLGREETVGGGALGLFIQTKLVTQQAVTSYLPGSNTIRGALIKSAPSYTSRI